MLHYGYLLTDQNRTPKSPLQRIWISLVFHLLMGRLHIRDTSICLYCCYLGTTMACVHQKLMLPKYSSSNKNTNLSPYNIIDSCCTHWLWKLMVTRNLAYYCWTNWRRDYLLLLLLEGSKKVYLKTGFLSLLIRGTFPFWNGIYRL